MTAESLEETIKKLQYQVEKLTAIAECNRLMGRYAYLLAQHRMEEFYQLFARDPKTRVYLGEMGYWEGPDAARRAWGLEEMREGAGLPDRDKEDRSGLLFLHPNETPYIEIAGDLKTAKGVWITDGIETGRNSVTKQLDPHWAWGAYGIDFINENGEWKFWHFHIYRLFAPHYNTSWVEWEADNPPSMIPSKDGVRKQISRKADGPPVDDYPYRANEVFIWKPDPPEPYETFNETFSY